METLDKESYNKLIEEKEDVIIQFTASWCGPCRSLSPILEQVSKEKNIKFLKCDISENSSFAKEKSIMSIPFVEVIKSGEVKETFLGFKNIVDINELLENVY